VKRIEVQSTDPKPILVGTSATLHHTAANFSSYIFRLLTQRLQPLDIK